MSNFFVGLDVNGNEQDRISENFFVLDERKLDKTFKDVFFGFKFKDIFFKSQDLFFNPSELFLIHLIYFNLPDQLKFFN